MRKRTILLIAIPAIITIVILFLSLMSFDSPALGQAVLSAAGDATKLRLTAEQFRLNILKGLSLKNVTAEGELFERDLEAQIESLEMQHRIVPLLKGNFSVKNISIVGPRIECTALDREQTVARPQKPRKQTEPTKPASVPSEESKPENLQMEISRVGIENTEITFRRRKNLPPVALIRGLDLVLEDFIVQTTDGSVLNSLSARGEFDGDEIHIGDTQIHKTSGEFEANNGTIHVPEARFTTKHGNFTVQLMLNLKATPLLYEMDLRGDPLDTNAIFGAEGKGSYGPGKLQLKGKGTGADSRNLNGAGTFSLSAGTLPSSEALAAVEWMIGKTKLIGSPYKASVTPFRIYDSKVQIERFLVELDQASLELSGSIYLEGPLSMRLLVKAPRQNVKVKEVPNEVVDALTDNEGWVSIPFQVRGTSKEPNVYLDTQALLSQAGQGAVKVIKKKLKDRLQELLNKQ